MTTKRKKTIMTILVLVLSIGAFVAFMIVQISNEKAIGGYTGILFGIIPAIMLNSIWNKRKIH